MGPLLGDVRLLKDGDGLPKGMGFADYVDGKSASYAISVLDGLSFGGRPLRVNSSQRKDAPGAMALPAPIVWSVRSEDPPLNGPSSGRRSPERVGRGVERSERNADDRRQRAGPGGQRRDRQEDSRKTQSSVDDWRETGRYRPPSSDRSGSEESRRRYDDRPRYDDRLRRDDRPRYEERRDHDRPRYEERRDYDRPRYEERSFEDIRRYGDDRRYDDRVGDRRFQEERDRRFDRYDDRLRRW